MTKDEAKKPSEAMTDDFAVTQLEWLSVTWVCTECKSHNHPSIDTWMAHSIQECRVCEKAHSVRSPFK